MGRFVGRDGAPEMEPVIRCYNEGRLRPASLAQSARRISRGGRRGSLAEAAELARKRSVTQVRLTAFRGEPGWHCVSLSGLGVL